MSAESPRHARAGGGPLTVPAQPPSDRGLIDAVSGFISDVTLSASSTQDPKDVIQWARFETADINEPTSEGDSDNDISPLLLILGYGSGVQVWLIPPTGEAQEVLSWRQGTVRVLRILPSPQRGDCFASKRPLVALCDSVSPGPSFCSLSFISIRGGEQVKSIKFKNQILDVLANKRSVVVSFAERFAVFDAGTLEDRLAVTTCFPCPCPLGGASLVNPLALGDRWLAFADKKLNQSKRSSGGCEGEGQTSYTATVLHAAKSLSKGLRGLGESVAHSLAGGRAASQSPSPPNADTQQPGVVTILDIEGADEENQENEEAYDPTVAHFVAHSEAITALKFDASGLLLVTADRRGHDFHVFRINPHPCGPSLASVHHLYVLHRGDTTAKVQDIALSGDSRWAAISTLRGTTHVFPLSPYGGPCGVRTHTAPRTVNRLSRFHRSAGLPIHAAHAPHAAASSPVNDGGTWFPNPRLPPYPQPTVVTALAQLRPTANLPTHTITRTSSGRQRLSSQSEDCNAAPLLARARFGAAPLPQGAPASKAASVNALYLVAASGCLSHIALHPRPARNVPKEKICDETPIELEVEPLAQWALQRPATAADLLAPLPASSPLLAPLSCRRCADMCMSEEERWLSQVEIVTHAGPHRRLWMGPQFVFKTYNLTGSNSSLSEAETVEVELSASRGVARSNPVNMPGARPIVPVLIDSGSPSSLEHSPSDSFRRKSLLAETGRAASVCDVQLKEDLAEAMKEDHGWREGGAGCEAWDGRGRGVRGGGGGGGVARVVDPLGTVLAPPPARLAPPLDNDDYTTPNSDEATFRPVVRAPATLTLSPDMLIRPLPRTTTIPVQNVSPLTSLSPEDEPLPLNTDVFIPATLTTVQGCHASNRLDEEELQLESVLFDASDSKSDAGEVGNFYAQDDAKLETSDEKKTFGIDLDKESQNNETVKEDDVEKDSVKTEKSSRQKESIPAEKTAQMKEPAAFDMSVYQKETNSIEKDDREKETPSDKVTEQKNNSTSIEKTSRQKDKDKSSSDRPYRKKEKEHKTSRQKETTPSEKSADNSQQRTITDKEIKKKENTPDKENSQKKSARDKNSHLKESTPKPDNNYVQTEIVENKSSKKDRGMKNEKPSGQEEMPIKLDRSADPNINTDKARNIVEEMPKEEIGIAQACVVSDLATKVDRINIDIKQTDVNKDLISEKIDDRKYDSERARGSAERAERVDSKSLPKSNLLSGDIQPTARNRVKKSPTLKSVSDKDSEDSFKNTKTKKYDETFEVTEQNDVKKSKDPKENREQKDARESLEIRDEKHNKENLKEDKTASKDKRITKHQTQDKSKTKLLSSTILEPSQLLVKDEVVKSKNVKEDNEIKTEDQAWDMLLCEPEKPVVLNVNETSMTREKSIEEKPKSRKNRKLKKILDETQTKSEEDSFVEIHAIEEKQQICSGDLVSISTPFEEMEHSSYTKAMKTRSPKCCTPDKIDEVVDFLTQTQLEPTPKPRSSKKFDVTDISAFSGPSFAETLKEPLKDSESNNPPKMPKHSDGTISEPTSFLNNPQHKKCKGKSLSPYPELHKPDIIVDVDKDVYIIDTTEEDFPEIQITRGNKPNRRSPQPAERKSLENIEKKIERFEPVAQTIKSWSSIAASKNKKTEEIDRMVDFSDKCDKKIEFNADENVENATLIVVERPMSSNKVSVEEKLLELYKRSDIMVAECDAPSELNFVEEHHAVIDLPPLEPLDFGLHDFKLDVMRDSLLDVNEAKITSPICKINIDDILSSIKETTSKAIESSAFNLIDLEKVPAKKEKGFSVVESHKITSQEVKLEDDIKEEVMEKSSDDDNTSPAVTTDSDKEDKKSSSGASNLTLPTSKQSAKSKKPRRKKK